MEEKKIETGSEKMSGISDFEHSVRTFDSTLVTDKSRTEKKRILSTAQVIRLVSALLCVGVFFVSAYQIFEKISTDIIEEGVYSEIGYDSEKVSALDRSIPLTETPKMLTLYQLLQTDGYLKQNEEIISATKDDLLRYTEINNKVKFYQSKYPDIYGWIYCEELAIDYPLNHDYEKGAEHYLNYNFAGKKSASGSIYVDPRCSSEHELNLNTVITGHNMSRGYMFGGLKDWNDKALSYKQKSAKTMKIEIYTGDVMYIYELFSVYISSDQDLYEKPLFDGTNDFMSYLTSIKNKSTVSTSQSYDMDSRICTLITCTNGRVDDRIIIHGIKRGVRTSF